MKLFHLSDLHLGKRIHQRSMIKDQEDILNQIVMLAEAEKPDAVMIAGDVYDRSVPPEEAVEQFDRFLVRLSELGLKVLIISGNHDSAERLSFGSRIMGRSGIFISPEFKKETYKRILRPTVLGDEFGEINFYMLPFITPSAVREAKENCTISSWNEMAQTVFIDMNIDTSKRNILIAHQFVTGAETCESENRSIGGADNIDFFVFDPFDYVALGHLHGRQHIGRETIRYCGTPLKYSFSEVNHHKSVTVVELGEKGKIQISELPLNKPLHNWRVITKKFADVMSEDVSDDYIKAVLTDEEDIPNVMNKLRERFENIMSMEYKRSTVDNSNQEAVIPEFNNISPADMFAEFYRQQRGVDLSYEQMEVVNEIFSEIREELK